MSIIGAFFAPHPPLIIPAVGNGQERTISATIDSYDHIAHKIAQLTPETIIIISPHSLMYRDYISVNSNNPVCLSLSNFGVKEFITAPCDVELAERVSALCYESSFPAGTAGNKTAEHDHGSYVPLCFINKYHRDYKLVIISPSGLSHEEHYRFGMILQNAIDSLGRRAVVIASGDLSHKLTQNGPYGFAPEGPMLDKALTGVMHSGDFKRLFDISEELCEKGAECGMRPLLILAGALDTFTIAPALLSYEGPFGVGYAVAAFEITGKSAYEPESDYVRLAKSTLEAYIKTGVIPPMPDNLPDKMLLDKAGVFVSIKKHGQLRGCIGTIAPTTDSVAEEIRQNAISSGTADPRFAAIVSQELPDLTYSVDVLGGAEPCTRDMLDPTRYGVIVTCGYRRGLLLPMLDGVDTIEEQIEIARQKAGIGRDEDFTLERFEVVRYI